MGLLSRNDLLPGKRFVLKRGGDYYVLTQLSREFAIYEDETGQEHTSQISWALEHWTPYEEPVEGWAWYCPTCKNFYKKLYDVDLKQCKDDGTEMVSVHLVESELSYSRESVE